MIPETTAPTVQRIDSRVDFPLVNNSVRGGNAIVRTTFFARWKGRIRIGKGGNYAFHLAAKEFAQRHLHTLPDKMLPDAVKEMLDAKEGEGASKVYMKVLKFYLNQRANA